jgi:DNA-binding CsgD family transcriptional regulator
MDGSEWVDAVVSAGSGAPRTSAQGLLTVLREGSHAAAAALTYVHPRTGRHHELAGLGYPEQVSRYLLTDFVHRDPGYRQLARNPGVSLCWADLPSYRDGYSAREVLTPNGYHEGSSTCLTGGDGTVIGAVHLSVRDAEFPAAGRRALAVLAPMITERVVATVARAAAGLTPREVEVLRLITLGRSNTAICAELVLSRRTVATHVEHILRKLGAANRVEAAVAAVRLNLCD